MAAPSIRRVLWQSAGSETGDPLVSEFERNATGAFARVQVAPLGPRRFTGVFATRRLGDITVSRIRASAYQVSRRAAFIGSGDRELVKVQVQHRGAVRVEQSGRQAVAGPGSVVAYSTTDPYRVAFDADNEVTVIGIPRSRFGALADRLARGTATPLPAFSPFLHTVSGLFDSHTGSGDDILSTHLGDALVSLFVAGLGSERTWLGDGTDARGGDGESADAGSAGRRILAYCSANLAEPRLSAAYLARVFSISERQVYKLVASEGVQLASWIRTRRLEGIRDDLVDPAFTDVDIATVVRDWGITDVTHISRALRAEFGASAAELRESTGRRGAPADA